ncbi:aldehyde dehydrogenase [Mycobacterium sp. 1423905.2]|uniref:aldehyde dehydrogenase n=1 Tax=Mycobacterium sp. 1423905.2 TaxID=1856859 RepID=UPI0007FC0BEC|nr:aldehyde dehydrogenase [Mycobacterium sp. 1423905.2]OBJ60348.1 aldehyde dehydrogenase [Mycobacterium sp. 1423905.2]
MDDVEPQLFIDGQFRSAEGVSPVIEAATERPLGQGPSASLADVDDAVASASKALADWSATPAVERAQLLERFADAVAARADHTNQLCTRETGMPITMSRTFSSGFPVAILRYYAGLAAKADVEEIRPSMIGHTIVRREPVGVVGAVVPWNVPQLLGAAKIGPALAVGCTVVLKPAPETALDARVFGEAAVEAGLPPGVLNVIPGGDEAGAHLVRHPGVDKVTFTGSTQVGRQIAEVCGRLMRPVTLELGGKSAAIVLDDADLELTMRELRALSFGNNGQICIANSRVLAPRSRYSEVVEALADMASSLVVGNPLDDNVDIGPLVSARQQKRVLGYIEIGKAEGARVITGGRRPADEPRGWYVAPTVFADVDNSARIAREEIFGPVVSVIPYGPESEAIEIANDSEFGLGGTVFTSDVARGTEVARAIRTGTIGVNQYQPDVDAPFGGVKASGLGREFGPEGLAAYQSVKSIFRPGAASEVETLTRVG